MNIKKLLGKKLQLIRKSKKLTQEQVAEFVGVDTTSISNIENGKYYPNAENLDKILQFLDTKPSEVFTFESYMPSGELIEEMLENMQKDEKLTRLLYRFYLAVRNS